VSFAPPFDEGAMKIQKNSSFYCLHFSAISSRILYDELKVRLYQKVIEVYLMSVIFAEKLSSSVKPP